MNRTFTPTLFTIVLTVFIVLFASTQTTWAHDGQFHSLFAPPDFIDTSVYPPGSIIESPDGPIFVPGEVETAPIEANQADSSAQTRAGRMMPLDDTGQWSDVIPVSLVPVGAANLPNGKMLFWSAYDRFDFGGNRGQTWTSIFDPATNQATERLVTETGHDMFCPGTTNMADGRIMVTGGSSTAETSIYNSSNNTWSSDDDMNLGRGYHAQTLLGNGNVFTIGGSWSGGRGDKHAELWNVSSGWELLSGIPVDPILEGITDPGGIFREDNHTWLWSAPNGDVFHAGPSTEMHWFDTSGNGSYRGAGARGNDDQSINGNTVMVDAGKLLKVGGSLDYGAGGAATASSYIIDLNGGTADVTRQGDLNDSRTMANSVVLPTGEVVVVGGLATGRTFSDAQARLNPEIWNPDTGAWRSLASMETPRTYHSVALLLPDGRVLAGGGGLCGDCNGRPEINHPNVEIFSPPYLFDGNNPAVRPIITSAPSSADNGDTITVQTNSAVTDFALVRLSSVTHSTNNDQRRIPLTPTNAGNNRYNLTLPRNRNNLLPGYYMLFAMDADGTPSVSTSLHITRDSSPQPPTTSGESVLIEAEAYTAQSGVRVVSGRDGNDDAVGYINSGDSTTYGINVPEAGSAEVTARVASNTTGGVINFILDGTDIGSITVPNTGGWNSYTTLSTEMMIPAAGNNQSLVLEYSGSSNFLLDINWFEFTFTGSATTPPPSTPSQAYSLQNVKSGKCVAIGASSQIEGTGAIQWTCLGIDDQSVQEIPGNGGFSLQFAHSGQCLTSTGDGNGADVVQASCTGNDNQTFNWDGEQLRIKSSDKCVVIANGSVNNGAKVKQAVCNDTPRKQFVRIESGARSGRTQTELVAITDTSEIQPTSITLLGDEATDVDPLALFIVLASVTVLTAVPIVGTKRS